MIGVERWAEIRRMHRGRAALDPRDPPAHRASPRHGPPRARGDEPPRYRRPPRPSKLDPFKAWIEEQLRADPAHPGEAPARADRGARLSGRQDDLRRFVREVRPRYLRPAHLSAHASTAPASCCSSTCSSRGPRSRSATARRAAAALVTAELGYSRALAGALVFSKEAPTSPSGMSRCLARLGALPEKLVWDREGAIHAGGGRPTDDFAGFCGQLAVGWVILEPGDCRGQGRARALAPLPAHNFEPGRRSPTSSTSRPSSTPGPKGQRRAPPHHARRRGRAARRGARADAPAARAAARRRSPLRVRVPPQPYLRFDRNDYSLDPRLAGRRVEVRVTQTRDHRGRARHRRAGLPPPARLRPRPELHRPRPPGSARASCAASAAGRDATSRSSSARWPATTALIPA